MWYGSVDLGTQSTGETRVGPEGESVWRRERNVKKEKRADADRPRGNKSAERRLGVGLAQEVEGVLQLKGC